MVAEARRRGGKRGKATGRMKQTIDQPHEAAVPPAPAGGMAVTLLGTGTPGLLVRRWGPATLVEANGKVLLFDAGRGCPVRLKQVGIEGGQLSAVFITHFHSDHVNGLPDLWMMRYLFGIRTKLETPLRVVGPPGVAELTHHIKQAFAADTRIRHADEHASLTAADFDTREFDGDGVVFAEDGVTVTAFEVNHGDLIKPAYGYRVDYGGHAVTISGDTKFHQNVITHGTGADLLVHEVCAAAETIRDIPFVKAIREHHTAPQEAGTVFARARPKLAVYTHFVLIGTPQAPAPTIDDVERMTRETYDGPLEFGEDLTRFLVGDAVAMYRWDEEADDYVAMPLRS